MTSCGPQHLTTVHQAGRADTRVRTKRTKPWRGQSQPAASQLQQPGTTLPTQGHWETRAGQGPLVRGWGPKEWCTSWTFSTPPNPHTHGSPVTFRRGPCHTPGDPLLLAAGHAVVTQGRICPKLQCFPGRYPKGQDAGQRYRRAKAGWGGDTGLQAPRAAHMALLSDTTPSRDRNTSQGQAPHDTQARSEECPRPRSTPVHRHPTVPARCSTPACHLSCSSPGSVRDLTAASS